MVSLKLANRSRTAIAVAAIFALGLTVNALTAPSGVYLTSLAAQPAFQPEASPLGTQISAAKSVAGSLVPVTTTIPLPTATETASPLPSVRMEIFSASLAVEVKNVKSTLTQIAGLAQQFGGFVAGTSASVFGENEVATIIIKVPRENFFQAVTAVQSLGKVKNLETRSDDVTEEFIDLKARRDNLQRQEQRLLEILKLGSTVDDVLKVERELERVRGEIERLTGRLNFIETNVEMSSIMVTLNTPGVEKQPEFDWTEPFRTGVGFFYGVVRGLVITAFILGPFALIGTPAYVAYRYRRSRSTKSESVANPKSI